MSSAFFSQTTWYISTTGADGNSGLSVEQAFATVNHAIGFAACGDSIYVMEGTYNEKINAYPICPENNRIVVQGDVNNRPLIIGDANAANRYAVGAVGQGFTFRHFEMTSPFPEDCVQANMVIVGSGDYFDFIDIIVHHSGYDGIKTTSNCEINDFPIGWRIIDSEVHSNGLGCPVSVLNGDGLDLTQCRNCLVENTIIRDNKGHQIQIKLEAKNVTIQNCHIEGVNLFQIGLPGNFPQCDPEAFNADSVFIRNNTILAKGDTTEFVFKLADARNLYIENNTIVKESTLIDVGFVCIGPGCGSADNWQNIPSAPAIIRNNIFYSRSEVPFYAGPDTTFFDPMGALGTTVFSGYNVFYDINGDFVLPPDNGTTSFVADPLLCNFPDSYELSQNSPCIDAGDPNGANDPDGTPNDIGAKYYQTVCISAVDVVSGDFQVKIYPNPSTGIFTIAGDKNLIGARLTLYNAFGQKEMQVVLETAQQRLNIEGLQRGLFYLEIKSKKGKTIKRAKLIKQ